jgi:5,5'-dehydrodivanillate O-demethylase oxygenase subunit
VSNSGQPNRTGGSTSLLTPEENERFTRVGPGTPGGELLRRYWWPVGFIDELTGPRPKRVRLLGQEFVLFRDTRGRVGLLDLLCAHRGTSLALGRVEDAGIRCCYHGWLFDAAGTCLEQPCEAPANPFKDKVRQGSYPTQVAAGVVFAYIGPLPAPLLPRYDMLHYDRGKRVLWSRMNYCNWLQALENACDVSHIPWLHASSYSSFAAKRPRITWDPTPHGLHFEIKIEGLPGENTGDVIFPAANRFASSREVAIERSQLGDRDKDARQNLLLRTPEDDVSFRLFFVTVYPDAETTQITQGDRSAAPGVYRPIDDGWWGIESVDQDRAAIEGQGPITDRSTEHLAPSDVGVTMYRSILRNALRDVEQGRDPIGIIRDPQKNELIRFDTRQHDVVPPLYQFAEVTHAFS